MVYLQGLDSLQYHVNNSREIDKYKIQINDVLYIKIVSDNKIINDLFNSPVMGSENISRFDNVSMYFNGYNVDNAGNIFLPEFGDVFVKGKNILEIEDKIQILAAEHIKNVSVVVKLASFKVIMLGEVGQPGIYYFYQENTTLFEALAMSGDLTDYGNRRNVLIIRPTETGSVSMRIDITDKSLLNSELYYLKPNDLIYVEPVKSKGIRLFASDYGTLITIFSTTTTAIVLILTLFN